MANRATVGTLQAGAFQTGGLSEYWVAVPITTALTGAEQDTGIDLPANAFVSEVLVNVKTAEVTGSTKTINVGILSSESGGDADGFIAGLSVASTGLKRPGATVTTGGTETYFSATTRGALLSDFLAGANVAGDVGTLYEKPFATSSITGKSISITAPNAFTEFRGTIYFRITKLEA